MIEQERDVVVPAVIRHEELSKIKVDKNLLERLDKILTPKEVLELVDFDHPRVLVQEGLPYPDFKSILVCRDDICRLKLVPLKDDEQYNRFHAQTEEHLANEVAQILGNSEYAASLNNYPYYLPEDLNQYIIWMKDFNSPREKVLEFAAKLMQVFGISEEELILFERPLGAKSKFVKGSFPIYRHAHFWFPKRVNI